MSKPWAALYCICMTLSLGIRILSAEVLPATSVEIQDQHAILFQAGQVARNKLNMLITTDFREMKLQTLLNFIAMKCDVDMNVHWSTMENAGIHQDTPITLQLENATGYMTLDMALKKASLNNPNDPIWFDIDQQVVHVSTRRQLLKQHRQTKVYNVSDMLDRVIMCDEKDQQIINKLKYERLSEIIELLQTQTGKQEDWARYGGDCASIRQFNNRIIVQAHASIQNQVQALLDELRNHTYHLYHSPPPPPTATDMKLQQLITVDFQATKLETVLSFLGKNIATNINVEWSVLKQVGIEPDMPITLSVKNARVGHVLDMVLELATARNGTDPLWHDQTPHSIKISTMLSQFRKNGYLRSYDIRGLILPFTNQIHEPQDQPFTEAQQKEQSVKALMELIQSTIYPQMWEGDLTTGSASIRELNGLLLVRAHESIQYQISQLIEALYPDPPKVPCIKQKAS